MKPDLAPIPCSGCGAPAHLVPRVRRIHRGDRVLAVDGWTWECPSDCPDPFTGDRPFRFSDLPLLDWEQKHISEVWQDRFGEPLPASERGRRPSPRRSMRVPVMLTPAELARLDEVRGTLTRSEYLRRALRVA